MEFTTVRELYHDRASYVGKEITVGGWVRLSYRMTVLFLRHFRSYILISSKILRTSAK